MESVISSPVTKLLKGVSKLRRTPSITWQICTPLPSDQLPNKWLSVVLVLFLPAYHFSFYQFEKCHSVFSAEIVFVLPNSDRMISVWMLLMTSKHIVKTCRMDSAARSRAAESVCVCLSVGQPAWLLVSQQQSCNRKQSLQEQNDYWDASVMFMAEAARMIHVSALKSLQVST